MRQRSSLTGRKHQLVLSLTPGSLELLHFQRTLLGWKRVHHASALVPRGDASLNHVASELQQRVAAWKIPAGARIQWVLAGDILGVLPGTGPLLPAAALPFAGSDTRTQPDLFAASDTPPLLWIHKDWLAEIERISELCGLELMELFARAQMYQATAARFPGPAKLVLEHQGPDAFFHIYAENGLLARSAVLEDPQDLQGRIVSELAALGILGLGEAQVTLPVLTVGQAPLPDWPGFNFHALPEVAAEDRIEPLWRSGIEGIAIRNGHDETVRQIQWLSVGLGAAGLAVLGAMFWHDAQLQQQIETAQEQVRRERPKVEDARRLKDRTLQMADLVQALPAMRDGSAAMAGLAQLLAQFPPPPDRLLYVRTDDQTLAFAATGNDASRRWWSEQSLPGYGALAETPLPDHLKDSPATFHWQAARRVEPPQPAPAIRQTASAPSTP